MPEREETLARLGELYEAYLKQAEEAERSARPLAGLLGIRGGAADDPCHDRFAVRLRGFYEELAAQHVPSGTARELMAYSCTAPLRFQKPCAAYWMLIAVQSLTQPLTGLLNAQDAGALAELWEKSFKRRERMPVQIELIKALKTAAKG